MWMTCRTESCWPIANDNRRIGLPSGNQPWLAGKLMSVWSPQLHRHLHLDDFPTMFDDQRIFVWYLQEVDAGSTQRFSAQRPVALSLCVSPPGWMERYPGQRRKRLGFLIYSWNWMFDNFLDSVMFTVKRLELEPWFPVSFPRANLLKIDNCVAFALENPAGVGFYTWWLFPVTSGLVHPNWFSRISRVIPRSKLRN